MASHPTRFSSPPPRHGLPPILPSPRLAGARHSLPARSLGAGRVPRCLLPPALLERKLPRTNDSGPLVAAPNRAQCYWTGGLTEGPAWRWALKKGGRPLETSRPQPGIAGDTHGVTPARPSLCPAWAAWARGRMRPWTKRTHAFGLCEWCSGLFEAAGSKLTVYRLALVSETCPHPPPPTPSCSRRLGAPKRSLLCELGSTWTPALLGDEEATRPSFLVALASSRAAGPAV